MSAETVQADYELLQALAKRFQGGADRIQEMISLLQNHMDALQGEWIGRGHDSFFGEMEGEVMPAVNRLCTSFQDAGTKTNEIAATVEAAEEESKGSYQCLV